MQLEKNTTDLNIQKKIDGKTALHISIESEKAVVIIKLLVYQRIDIFIQNRNNQTPHELYLIELIEVDYFKGYEEDIEAEFRYHFQMVKGLKRRKKQQKEIS